jgi:hypothetical protein
MYGRILCGTIVRKQMNTDGINEPAQAIDKNEDAMRRYRTYEELLK